MIAGCQNINALIEQIHEAESALPLRNEACRSKFFLHPHPTPKVLLFLHGFTAGPYQGGPIGQAFYEAGYNVLVPLQPGHGHTGDWSGQNPPPLPEDLETYQTFVLGWLRVAETLGEKVIVGGLSTGANLAAWLAFNYRDRIDRALLFAPYLSNPFVGVDWIIENLSFYFEWFNKDAPGNFGYPGFRIPALRIFLELAQEILDQAKTQTPAPILLACSEADKAASLSSQEDFFQTILQRQPQSWYYCFDESLEIKHRMMTEVEGNDHEKWVIALAQAYVESDLSWAQLQVVANHITQGESIDAIASYFNLESQLVKNLSKLVSEDFGCHDLKCILPSS